MTPSRGMSLAKNIGLPSDVKSVTGLIDTPMFGSPGEERTSKLEGATAGHPIPRPGTADEVAQGVLFTIQNDFVTGTTVDIDGGWLLS